MQLSFRISAEDAVVLDRSLKILGMPTRTACAKFLLERAIAVLADEFDLLVPAFDPEENEPEDEA